MKKITMKNWIGYNFESSSGTTDEFKKFASDLKKYIKQELPELSIESFSVGHFYVSAFLKTSDDKLIYINTSDVRGRFNSILFRTAKSTKDFSGGSNNYCSVIDIKRIVSVY